MKKLILIISLLFYSILIYSGTVIKFVESKNNIPMVTLNIGGIDRNFLVDSGSEVSLIDYDYVNSHREIIKLMYKDDVIFHTINSNNESEYTYRLIVEMADTDVKFTTIELSEFLGSMNKKGYKIIGLLGSDFLREHDFVIDYKNKCIRN